MPEPIEYQIALNVQNTLKGIAVASGYFHTVASLAVKLDPNHKVEDLIAGANPPPPRPWLVLEWLQDQIEYDERPNRVKIQQLGVIHLVHNTDPTDDTSKMKTFFRLCADAEQALAVDVTRGSLAYETRVLGRTMSELERNEIWVSVAFVVVGKRTYGKPNG